MLPNFRKNPPNQSPSSVSWISHPQRRRLWREVCRQQYHQANKTKLKQPYLEEKIVEERRGRTLKPWTQENKSGSRQCGNLSQNNVPELQLSHKSTIC